MKIVMQMSQEINKEKKTQTPKMKYLLDAPKKCNRI